MLCLSGGPLWRARRRHCLLDVARLRSAFWRNEANGGKRSEFSEEIMFGPMRSKFRHPEVPASRRACPREGGG